MKTIEKLPYLAYEVKNGIKPSRLWGFAELYLEEHWKLYKSHVTQCNFLNKTIWETLQSGRELSDPALAPLLRGAGFEYNGMILHEYYFGALKMGVSEPSAGSELVKKFTDDFGGLNHWKKQFAEIGRSRGSGWAVTYLDPYNQHLVNAWIDGNEGGLTGFIPLIVMDAWEHAYLPNYNPNITGRADYIEVFLKNLDWKVVEKRLEFALQSRMAPRA